MSPQYLVARQCLQLLKQSPIPGTRKLRLEIQFVQLIRLLLQEDLDGSERGVCSKEAFDAIHRNMSRIGHNTDGQNAVTFLMEAVGEILVVLSARSTDQSDGAIHARL